MQEVCGQKRAREVTPNTSITDRKHFSGSFPAIWYRTSSKIDSKRVNWAFTAISLPALGLQIAKLKIWGNCFGSFWAVSYLGIFWRIDLVIRSVRRVISCTTLHGKIGGIVLCSKFLGNGNYPEGHTFWVLRQTAIGVTIAVIKGFSGIPSEDSLTCGTAKGVR